MVNLLALIIVGVMALFIVITAFCIDSVNDYKIAIVYWLLGIHLGFMKRECCNSSHHLIICLVIDSIIDLPQYLL